MLPPDLLSVFDAHELELLLCERRTPTSTTGKKHTEYAGEYRRRGSNHPVVKWWWRAVRAWSPRTAPNCCGSARGARVPSFGFRASTTERRALPAVLRAVATADGARASRARTRASIGWTCRCTLLYAELAAGLRVVLAMEATGFTMCFTSLEGPSVEGLVVCLP